MEIRVFIYLFMYRILIFGSHYDVDNILVGDTVNEADTDTVTTTTFDAYIKNKEHEIERKNAMEMQHVL